MTDRTCSIIGCRAKHYGKGWCKKHYGAHWRHGDPLFVPVQRTPVERFHEKYNVTDTGCWIWFGATRNGYGEFSIGFKKHRAHRFSYEAFRGPIPERYTIDHLCRTPLCVNPGHLEPVERGENVLRGISPAAVAARRDNCQRGHAYTPENTRTSPAQRGRACRTCDRDSARLRHRAKRAAMRVPQLAE